MADLNIAGLDGSTHTISSRDMASLTDHLDGEVLYPEMNGYEETTVLWNAMIRKRPAVVVRPADTGDVVHVVNFVRERGLQLSIRGGGHNIAGLALCDGGLTLDMSRLKRVEVDVDARLAHVGISPPVHHLVSKR